MLLIEVDVLEAFWQYEVVSDGKVIFKYRDDTICDVDPFFCNLPAGGKLPPKKRATEKKNENKRKKGRKKMKEKKKERKEGRENKKKERIKRHFFHSEFS